jgi:three-Cys-motif partner protein
LNDILDDGLIYNDVGSWTEAKHRLVAYYAAQFSAGMKDRWDERIYIELYAGAGYSRIRGTDRLIAGSPIQALALKVHSTNIYSASKIQKNWNHCASVLNAMPHQQTLLLFQKIVMQMSKKY